MKRSRLGIKTCIGGVLAILCAACAPTSYFVLKSPDRRHRAEIRATGGAQVVWLDGKVLGRYEGVAPSTFVLNRDAGKWAYAARQGQYWRVYHSQGVSAEWDGVGEVRFLPTSNRLVYSAERAGYWHVVIEDTVGPPLDAVLQGTMVESPDGIHLAYAAIRKGKTTVISDNTFGPDFDGVGSITFGTNGDHLAYAGRRNKRGYAVWDGKISAPYSAISELTLNPAGDQLAYLARDQDGWHAVVEGFESRPYPSAWNLVFSPDGQFTSFVAEIGGRECVVENGIPNKKNFLRIREGSLAYKSGNRHPTYVGIEGEKEFLVDGGQVSQALDEISGPTYSADFSHWGYSARSGKSWKVFVDGDSIAEENWASAPVFGKGSAHVYLSHRDGRMAVIAAKKSAVFDLILEESIMFSQDGNHWGCIAGNRKAKDFFFVIDGIQRRVLEWTEILGWAMNGATENKKAQLHEWVAAELALAEHR